MVRLTDLVGAKKNMNKTGAEQIKPVTPSEPSSGGGFLRASDLTSYYELSSQQDSTAIPASGTVENSANKSVQPSQAERGIISSESGLDEKGFELNPREAEKQSFLSREKESYQEADAIHIELLDILEDIYNEGKKDKALSVERLIDPILKLITICRKSNAIIRKAVRYKRNPENFTSHSLNVAIVSIKTGICRKFSRERLFSLALCALLGDIGMTKVDTAILIKKEKLNQNEFQEIMMHIVHSRDIVSEIADKFPFLAPIIYQLHERENGEGYPEGLKGGNIHEFAKIIGMSDVYIAMTSPKIHRDDFSGFEALQKIVSKRGIDFSPEIIKSLIDVISIFPLESLVKLNNGAIGRVVEISPVHPTRPILKILVNSDGVHLKTSSILDLENEPLLYVEDPDIEEGAVL